MRFTLLVDQPSSPATASRLIPLASRSRRSAAPRRRLRIVGTETMAPDNATATSSPDSDNRVTVTRTLAVQIVQQSPVTPFCADRTPSRARPHSPQPAPPPEPRGALTISQKQNHR